MDASQKKRPHLEPRTPRMRRFIAEYLKDFTGARTAVRAGYEPPGAETWASELRNITVQCSVRPPECRQMLYSPGVSTKNDSNFAALSGQRSRACVQHRAKFDLEPRESCQFLAPSLGE